MPFSPRLSILTDEVSQDLSAVIRFAQEFNLPGIELRSLLGKACRDLSLDEVREVRRRCDDAGLRVSGVATPVFKCDLDDAAARQEHRDIFRRALQMAAILGCEVVRVFTFLRHDHPTSPGDLARASDHFLGLLEIAHAHPVTIGVENEASCLVGTGAEMATLLGHLPAHPQLGVVWDPCNVLWLEGDSDPVRDDFPLVADRVRHVHVKDSRRVNGKAAHECLELGEGEVNFPEQFRRLQAQGYDGWVTLETHWRGATKLDAETHHLPAGHGFSAGAEPASRVCMAHLQRLLAGL